MFELFCWIWEVRHYESHLFRSRDSLKKKNALLRFLSKEDVCDDVICIDRHIADRNNLKSSPYLGWQIGSWQLLSLPLVPTTSPNWRLWFLPRRLWLARFPVFASLGPSLRSFRIGGFDCGHNSWFEGLLSPEHFLPFSLGPRQDSIHESTPSIDLIPHCIRSCIVHPLVYVRGEGNATSRGCQWLFNLPFTFSLYQDHTQCRQGWGCLPIACLHVFFLSAVGIVFGFRESSLHDPSEKILDDSPRPESPVVVCSVFLVRRKEM